jgi:hypothetical protein
MKLFTATAAFIALFSFGIRASAQTETVLYAFSMPSAEVRTEQPRIPRSRLTALEIFMAQPLLAAPRA